MENQRSYSRALITGASRGLGRALAEALASEGVEVLLVARHRESLRAVVDRIRVAGGRASALIADVGVVDPQALAARVSEEVGAIDLLVHNASSLGPVPMVPLAELSDRALSEVFEVNVLGPQRLTRAFLGGMRRLQRGTIVTISSDAAVAHYPTWGAYGASKAALDHFVGVLNAELSAEGIRAIAIDPGEMNTRMHADALPEADPARLADPREVAQRIVKLLRKLPEGHRVAA